MDLLHAHTVFDRTAPGVYERVNDRTWWGHQNLFGGTLALEYSLIVYRDPGIPGRPVQVPFRYICQPHGTLLPYPGPGVGNGNGDRHMHGPPVIGEVISQEDR